MTHTCSAEEQDIKNLKARLAEAEETLRAIYNGDVDALIVAGSDGDQVFTLKGAETPYRLLVEAMNEGALTLIPDGTILFCNTRFAQMARKPLRQVTGSLWREFFSPAEHARFEQLLQRAKTGGSKGEFSLQAADGSDLPVEISARSFQLDQVEGFSILVTDITERHLAEQALLKAKEELELRVRERTSDLSQVNQLLRAEIKERERAEEELKASQEELRVQTRDLEQQVAERTAHLQAANKALETLCYNMAHDLRAPNRAMKGFAEILLEDYGQVLGGTGQDYLRRIAAAAGRNDRLILDMLTYGKLGHIPLPVEERSLESIIRNVLQNLADEINNKWAKIDVKPPLPPVRANAMALEQALLNLLSNAMKFVPDSVTPTISIWTEEKGENVRVCIRDNGIGIAPEDQQRVFRVFERLAAASKYPGTGIGLAIVHKAAERMGGRVGLDSEVGKGSCFWIELPKAE